MRLHRLLLAPLFVLPGFLGGQPTDASRFAGLHVRVCIGLKKD
ncbi:hypothetical protein J421_0952 [Gemmatirosa kalamazoonensis]|uniref:Uncharacterized protein n=1 Tax=Gemmatirosa kalamazoonensis TaxID=861299 RepID=W0RBK4_9BACT|nr:hypothetical protein J421_0952 [Gemmatirosa kalamazoonensis]